MTILEPADVGRELVPVGDWHPTHYTPSLSGGEDFRTEGDRLIVASRSYWSVPEVEVGRFALDPWQEWLIRHVLERYPDDWPDERLRGQFRFRQVVISMGRQNGKSLLAALFGFYGLTMHLRGPRVLGVARSVPQANIVYDRVKYAVKHNAVLDKRLKATGTRGISHRDGSGMYETQPADEDALQGWPISLALFDELHIAPAGMWGAIVNGQRSRANALLVGITTAGDDDSELLLRLYKQGHAAIAGGEPGRFGFFVWEAPDDELTRDNVIAANPAIACGRIDVDTVMADAADLPEADVIRYTLNRFSTSTATALPVGRWHDQAGDGIPADLDTATPVVFGLDRAESWTAATITAATKLGETLHTEAVAALVRPTHEHLVELCLRLRDSLARPVVFAMDGVMLSAVGKELRDRGLDVWILSANETAQAAATTYAAIARGRLDHAGDPLVSSQLPRAKRRNTGEAWRISRRDSTGDIDAVLATVWAVYVAEIARPVELQLFVGGS